MLYCSQIPPLWKKELLPCFPGEGKALEKALPAPGSLCSWSCMEPEPCRAPSTSTRMCLHPHPSTAPAASAHVLNLAHISEAKDLKNPASVSDDFTVTKASTSLGSRRCEDFQEGASCALWPGERLPPATYRHSSLRSVPAGKCRKDSEMCTHL